jgi:hypothetical protein
VAVCGLVLAQAASNEAVAVATSRDFQFITTP